MSMLKAYARCLDAAPGDPAWTMYLDPCASSSPSFENTGVLLLISACDSWKRLVFMCQREPFTIFKVVNQSCAEAQGVFDDLVSRRNRCATCIHAPFTGVLLDYYQRNQGCIGDIQRALRDTVLSVPVTSEKVERLHANLQVGNNANQNAGRIASNVQRESYTTIARIQHKRLKDKVESQVFGNSRTRAKFLLRSRRIDSNTAADTSLRKQTVPRSDISFLKPRRATPRTSTWNIFCSQAKQFSCGEEQSQAYRAVMRSVEGRRSLEEAARQVDRQRQAAMKRRLSTLPASSKQEHPAGGATLSYKQRQRLGHDQLDNSLQLISSHCCWDYGLGLMDCNTALKPSFVLDMPLKQVERESGLIFDWDPAVESNPSTIPPMFCTCFERCGGICTKQRGAEKANILAHQYIKLFDQANC